MKTIKNTILYAVYGACVLQIGVTQATTMDSTALSGVIDSPHSQSIANPAIDTNSLLPQSKKNDCISNAHIIFPGGVTLIGHGKKAFDGVCTIQPNGLPAFVLIPVYPTMNFNGVHHFIQPVASSNHASKSPPTLAQEATATGLSQSQLRSMGQ